MSRPASHGSPLANVALWQFAIFFLLILFLWVSDIADLPSVLWDAPPSSVNYVRNYMLSLGMITVAVVTVGHTYLLQKRMLRGILMLCTRCRKVRINEDQWEWIEHYVARHSLVEVSHGLCPSCMQGEMAVALSKANKIEHPHHAKHGGQDLKTVA